MVPDNDISGLRMCSYGRNDLYVHPSVKLDYSTRLIRRCRKNSKPSVSLVIQNNSELGMNSEFCGTIIGVNCKVADNTHMDQCMVMDDSHIGSDCKMVSALLGTDVTVGSNCELLSCVLGPGVVIEPGTSLSSQLVIKRADLAIVQEELSSIQDLSQDPVIQSLERFLEQSKDSAEEQQTLLQGDLCILPLHYDTPNKWIEWSRDSFSKCQGFESDDEEEEADENLNNNYYTGLSDFVKNLEDRHGENMGDILTEINCFRMSCNCSYSDIVRNLVTIMIEFCWKPEDTLEEWVGFMEDMMSCRRRRPRR